MPNDRDKLLKIMDSLEVDYRSGKISPDKESESPQPHHLFLPDAEERHDTYGIPDNHSHNSKVR